MAEILDPNKKQIPLNERKLPSEVVEANEAALESATSTREIHFPVGAGRARSAPDADGNPTGKEASELEY